jgi:hypothetical protein
MWLVSFWFFMSHCWWMWFFQLDTTMSWYFSFLFNFINTQTDRHSDRQTDRHSDIPHLSKFFLCEREWKCFSTRNFIIDLMESDMIFICWVIVSVNPLSSSIRGGSSPSVVVSPFLVQNSYTCVIGPFANVTGQKMNKQLHWNMRKWINEWRIDFDFDLNCIDTFRIFRIVGKFYIDSMWSNSIIAFSLCIFEHESKCKYQYFFCNHIQWENGCFNWQLSCLW